MANLSSLLEARYGTTSNGSAAPPAAPTAANSTIETLLQHKSVRNFLPEPLAPGTLELLTAAAQSAATSSNLQPWSAVAITTPSLKSQAATLCGDQAFIRAAPLFIVFCADLARLTTTCAQHGTPGTGLEFLEMYTMATIDASLAAQNACVAAESLGLGACYVGAARNRPRELASLLSLPPRVVALFGLAVGRPDPGAPPATVKPRLAQDEVVHRETWGQPGGDGPRQQEGKAANLAAYDEALADFNAKQGRGDAPAWTYRSAHRIATVESLHGRDIFREVLEERGFELR
ncbi:FMN reductase (NADPH) [Daldinia childiae]|uniref:FMN reductase (NADPH) n=1 Tax=Daldinia childiae TaxID=326645 RepID=UPI0014471738|nr:FMN reductase (NADPH) [Daldinia childiae]KAF3068490.1 FMN reductase (NADPH) [Daldinia childiae]